MLEGRDAKSKIPHDGSFIVSWTPELPTGTNVIKDSGQKYR